MAEPFLAEIRLVSFNFPPKGWALCNGQFMPINQNQALFSLLGTTYGGNGQTTFALPDLRGRSAIHFGGNYVLGQTGGAASHTLNASEMAAHGHYVTMSNAIATSASPAGAVIGKKGRLGRDVYGNLANAATLVNSTTQIGGSQPHENNQPFLGLTAVIALQGIFPSQN
jgi:microcystin-dependent protein